ncbi:MAG: hypothetical protein H0X33_04730 [Taibaiella sp.]|nr:hypothetical protein [Taibaiella sp.]
MIIFPNSESESLALIEYLETIDGKDISSDERKILLKVFDSTEHFGLRDFIGVTLIEIPEETLFPLLIKKIRENIHTKYVSTLIFCCSYYDCSKFIQLFVDVIIVKSDMCLADAMGVIRNMKKIDNYENEYATNKLLAYLEEEKLYISESKQEDVTDVINFLKKRYKEE